MSFEYAPLCNEGICARVHCELFDCDVDLMVMSGDTDYAERCLDFFNALSPELLKKIKLCTLRYCEDFRQFFDKDFPEVPKDVDEENIFDYITPRVIIVHEPKDFNKLAFGVEIGCEWEKEHGMEWVFNDGELLYVGDYVGMSPWYAHDLYERERMNYVYFEHCI